MHRYLVVANQTLGGRPLADKVRACLAAGPCRFHVLVPATHPHEHATWTEGEAVALAEQRLREALERFRAMGADADGEVGDASPLEAISDVLLWESFDEVILSTFPRGISRWLGQDLLHRVERKFGIPVSHVVAEPETSAKD